MQKNRFSFPALVLSFAFFILTVVAFMRWNREAKTRKQVFRTLAGWEGPILPAIDDLLKQDAESTIAALLLALDGEDEELRARAARPLSLLPRAKSPATITALAHHLKTDPCGKNALFMRLRLDDGSYALRHLEN